MAARARQMLAALAANSTQSAKVKLRALLSLQQSADRESQKVLSAARTMTSEQSEAQTKAAHKQRGFAPHETHVREEDHHLLNRLQRLLLLVDSQRQDLETHAVVLEVRAHPFAVDVVHPRIAHEHAAPVVAEAIGDVGDVHVEATLPGVRVDERVIVLKVRACLHIDLELTSRA